MEPTTRTTITPHNCPLPWLIANSGLRYSHELLLVFLHRKQAREHAILHKHHILQGGGD